MGSSTIHNGRQSAGTPQLPVATQMLPTSPECEEQVSSSGVETPAVVPSCQNTQEKPTLEPGGGELVPGRRARTWPQKFRDAFRGVGLGVWGQNSFLVHGFFTIAALVAGAVFQISLIEWLIVLLCIVTVWTAEMFNSALERLARAVSLKYDPHIRDALDIGSGAVLVAAIGAATIGGILFLFHFFKLVGVL
jgi:diacylglycerol kinase